MTTNTITPKVRAKKRKTNLLQLSQVVQDIKSTISDSKNDKDEEDEFTIFGAHVASQLKRLSIEQALCAQEEIQSVLTRCRLNDLRARSACSSVINILSPPPPSPTISLSSSGINEQMQTGNYGTLPTSETQSVILSFAEGTHNTGEDETSTQGNIIQIAYDDAVFPSI